MHQGSVLSPLIFAIVVDVVTEGTGNSQLRWPSGVERQSFEL